MKRARFQPILLIGLLLSLLPVGCAPASLPSGADVVWDLVIIGDSSLWELGEAYAAQIEKDQGVQVVVHDFALPSLSAGSVLDVLETGSSVNARLEALPEALKKAEVVVLWANPEDSVDPADLLGIFRCFGNQKPADAPCSLDGLAPFTADLEAIWQHVIDLRDGQATILFGTDLYNPLIAEWQRTGAFSDCTECWDVLSAAARQAAEAYGIPFLSRLDLYNGVDRTEDPVLKGFIQEDGEHPSQAGAEATALALSQMGYEPAIP